MRPGALAPPWAGAARRPFRHLMSLHEQHTRAREMVKRQRTSVPEPEAETTMMDSASAVLRFKVNYDQAKHLAAGEAVHSGAITAGGHTWRINCYPRGINKSGSGDDLSISAELLSKSRANLFLSLGGAPPPSSAVRFYAKIRAFMADMD
ncbi:hypothetical protein ACP70R_000486 [Stipagrostis hirtigluma subsp. patula]